LNGQLFHVSLFTAWKFESDCLWSSRYGAESFFIQEPVTLKNLTKDELIQKLEQMQVREQQYRTLLDDCSDPIFSFNHEGQYLYVNRQFTDGLIDKTPEDIIGKKIWDIFPKEEADKRFAVVERVFDNGKARSVEVCVPGPDGDHYYLTTVKPILNEQGGVGYVICISKEITGRKLKEEKLRRTALYDILTGLPNRALFNDRLKFAITQAKRKAARIALMFIDLDNFKPINDTHGHNAGDLLLKLVAKRMKNCIRESDTVGRIGGDEFILLLPAITKPEDALNVAEKIRHEINKPFDVPGFPVMNVSSSTGVAIYPEHGNNATHLIKSADEAMYLAKERGRNNVALFQLVKTG
jgi:diguanylate cyclase (GGDEF)-like protein/PAS domain S-box-containing protein